MSPTRDDGRRPLTVYMSPADDQGDLKNASMNDEDVADTPTKSSRKRCGNGWRRTKDANSNRDVEGTGMNVFDPSKIRHRESRKLPAIVHENRGRRHRSEVALVFGTVSRRLGKGIFRIDYADIPPATAPTAGCRPISTGRASPIRRCQPSPSPARPGRTRPPYHGPDQADNCRPGSPPGACRPGVRDGRPRLRRQSDQPRTRNGHCRSRRVIATPFAPMASTSTQRQCRE